MKDKPRCCKTCAYWDIDAARDKAGRTDELTALRARICKLEAGIEREAAHHERMAEEAGMCERDHEAHVASRNAARLRALLSEEKK